MILIPPHQFWYTFAAVFRTLLFFGILPFSLIHFASMLFVCVPSVILYIFSNDSRFCGHNCVCLILNTLSNNQIWCGTQYQRTIGLLKAMHFIFCPPRLPQTNYYWRQLLQKTVTNLMTLMILMLGKFHFINIDLEVRSSNDLLLRVNVIDDEMM